MIAILIVYFFKILMFVELITSIVFFLGIKLYFKTKKVSNLALILLVLNFIITIGYLFNIFSVGPFYIIAIKNIYFYIIYLIINFLLLLGYVGIDDDLKEIHRILVSIFLMFNSLWIIII